MATKQVDTQPSVVQPTPGAKAVHVGHDQYQLQSYMMQETITKLALTVTVDISSTTGMHSIEVPPDSGADISMQQGQKSWQSWDTTGTIF